MRWTPDSGTIYHKSCRPKNGGDSGEHVGTSSGGGYEPVNWGPGADGSGNADPELPDGSSHWNGEYEYPPPTAASPTHRLAPRIVPVTTSSGESSGPLSSRPASSGVAELTPTGPRPTGDVQAPPQGADRQGQNVSFRTCEFLPTYQNSYSRHCFRCDSTNDIATRCPAGTRELSTQEQQTLRQEWLRRTGRTAALVAHTAISEEESDLESVEGDSHISGRDTRRTPGARMAQPVDGTMIRNRMGKARNSGTGTGCSNWESLLSELEKQADQMTGT